MGKSVTAIDRRASFAAESSIVRSFRTQRRLILTSTSSNRRLVWAHAGIAALAVFASLTGLRNGFALDDLALVADNARAHSLDAWGRVFALPYWPPQYGPSLYRPVVTLAYAVQWTAAQGNPLIYHVTSIALYATVSVLVLALFMDLVPAAAALAGAALFAVHPVHVEAVANVVGQSELLAALAALGASLLYVRARRTGPVSFGVAAAIAGLFAIACLCKEHALLLPLLLVTLELWGVDQGPSTRRLIDRVRATAPLYATLGAIAVAYVLVRTAVVGGLLGEKHLVPLDGMRRLWVMLVVVPEWGRLLAWPARLSADYSPQQLPIPDGAGPEIVTGAVILIAAVAAFLALGTGDLASRDERRAARLGLAWLAITLFPVSNLFSVMLVAERTLLMPSVGAMLLIAAMVSLAVRRASGSRAFTGARIGIAFVVVCLVALGTMRSRDRHPVWRDDATLFAQTAEDAPRSYRAQFFYGQMLFGAGKRAEGERRLRLAIALNPTRSDVSPLNYLATQYRDAGMCPQALPLYDLALTNDAERPDVRYGLAACLLATGRVQDARRIAEDGARRGDLKSLFLQIIARTDSLTHRGG